MMASMAIAVLLQSKHVVLTRNLLCFASYLPSLTIADDKLSLTTADGDERVDGFNTSLHGLTHGDTRDDTGSLDTDTGTIQ